MPVKRQGLAARRKAANAAAAVRPVASTRPRSSGSLRSDTGPPARALGLDALRGLAIVWMVAYHFSFDLNLFRLLQPVQHFNNDGFWTLQRTGIVSLFMLCAGAGQALAEAAGQRWPRFWRRWAQVAGCAVAVSVASAWMFPRSWISFGVLHGLALMLLLSRALTHAMSRRWPNQRCGSIGLLALAALALLLPQAFGHPLFDGRWLNWVGLVTHKPVTEDFVPLLPWWGVMLLGLVIGRWWLRRRPQAPGAAANVAPGPLAAAGRRGLRGLALLGRWPLTIYMLHQPLLLGALWLFTRR